MATAVVPGFGTTVVGIDLTVDGFSPEQVHQALMARLGEVAKDGELLVAVGIYAHTFLRPKQLAMVRLPERRGIKGRDRATALESFGGELVAALKDTAWLGPGGLDQSRILEFFPLAGQLFGADGQRSLILVSDMLQVDDDRNWERGDPIESIDLRIAKVGGYIEIYGVQSPAYVSTGHWEAVESAWQQILGSAGVKIGCYKSFLQ